MVSHRHNLRFLVRIGLVPRNPHGQRRALTIFSQRISHRAFGSAREGELINQDQLPNLGRSPKEGLDVGTNVFAPARCEATPKLVSITYSNAYSAL